MGFFDSLVDESTVTAPTPVATTASPPASHDAIISINDSITPIATETMANTAAEMFQPPALIDDMSEIIILSETPTETPAQESEILFDTVTHVPAEVSITNEPIFSINEPVVIMDAVPKAVVPSEEIPRTEATLAHAIAEFQADLARIQARAKQSFDMEADLLAQKTQKEVELKQEIARLSKSAAEARAQALETEKSGERTEQLIKLFETQMQAA